MSTSTPTPEPRGPVVQCLLRDATAIERLLARTTVERERPGSAEDRYLDHLIGKPWGFEFRVYDDALIDIWMLSIKAGTRTSMHCHPRKDTVLLCVSGHGELTTHGVRSHTIDQGTVLLIKQGAFHRSYAATDMVLVEIETPRDKYDLLRLVDDNGRALRKYEHAGYVTQRLDPLEAVRMGPPNARLRRRCPSGVHCFGLEEGSAVAEQPSDLVFAISLDLLGVLRREIGVTGGNDLGAISAKQTYLTIRSTHKEDSP